MIKTGILLFIFEIVKPVLVISLGLTKVRAEFWFIVQVVADSVLHDVVSKIARSG